MEQYLGQIIMLGCDFAPRGYYVCDGSLKLISNNENLYSLIGNTYGGDNITTFAVPDFRGRAPVGLGIGDGVNPTTLGKKYGQSHVVLTEANLPSHAHSLKGLGFYFNGDPGQNNGNKLADISHNDKVATGTFKLDIDDTEDTGENTPLDITNPNQCVTFAIAHYGLYPFPQD